MKTVYFDNASTSHPKAPGVASAIHSFIEQGSFNPSRGQYTGASATGLAIFELRKTWRSGLERLRRVRLFLRRMLLCR